LCVLGNHDVHLLARAAGAEGAKKRDTLDDVLRARDLDRIVDWLRVRPLVHVEGSFAMVHGGLHPHWTIDDARARAAEIERELAAPTWRAFLGQLGGKPPRWTDKLGGSDRWRAILAYLIRARTLKPDGRVEPEFDGPPSEAPEGCVPWFAFPSPAWATHTVVFGHWAALGLSLGKHHIGLDSGCVWGNTLTAIRLDDRAVFQVKASEAAGADSKA
jgi:bis(5'-nucleosyl)-tetraphosphatase (symmetrical)